MASRILYPRLIPTLFVSSALVTPLLLRPQQFRYALRADASSPASSYSYTRDASTPVLTSSNKVNPRAFRQISLGSITGLLSGLAVSVFSKPLALLIGLLVFGVQALERSGIHVVPYGWLRRYYNETDLRSAVMDNVAFKLSFGATFALAGFASFDA